MRGTAMMLLAMLAAAPAVAQTPPPTPADNELFQFLSRTPVTLMDWGMMRLERDLSRALVASGLRDRAGENRTGTMLRGDRRVLGFASLVRTPAQRTPAACNDAFVALKGALLADAPTGPSGAAWYLQRVFGSEFRREAGQPEPFGERLLDMVLIEVTLRAPLDEPVSAGTNRLSCAGRLDEESAAPLPGPQAPRS
ncbi:MAG TPA: hypothetical protein VED40_01490 [Azospirillaceae bacterium]|nr:hypothetical protein [Azospirillaceae bacterium]